MDALLRIKSPSGERIVKLKGEPTTIGRQSGNFIILDEPLASRQHCVIENTAKGLILRDLKSSNGTRINGQLTTHASLYHGDIITIGDVTMTVDIPGHAKQQLAAEEHVDDLEVVDEPNDPMAAHRALRRMAEALPEKLFDVDAITLINTRGSALKDPHSAGMPPSEADLLLRLVFMICFRAHATDIHLEPRVEDFLLRVRFDGNLLDLTAFNRDLGIKFIALIKILCDLDTTQRTIVQEGHFAATAPIVDRAGVPGSAGVRRVDYRVSLVPTLHGQKMVVRIFDTGHGPVLLEDLDLPAEIAADIREELTSDAGLILVCGPTGSGKTTTLYSLLRTCGSSFRNIVTIEDPVEVQLEGTTQLPVDEANGKSFAALLRSVLRQDPDVIMVGEIRDSETAKIALQAAVTGHLVLSTIHTRDTPGTIFRMLDLGIEPYMVSQGLHLVLAQRLVRALCKSCKKPVPITDQERRRMGKYADGLRQLFAPVGCPKCLGTGFHGRRAFFEFLKATDALRDRVMKSPSLPEIQEILGSDFVRLSDHGHQLVAQGVTSLEEVHQSIGR